MTVKTLAHITHRPTRMRRRGLFAYLDLYAQRRALAKLNQTQLQDIGVSRAEAKAEIDRRFWDAPCHWYM